MRTRTSREPRTTPVQSGTAREAALKLLDRTRRTRSDLARRLRDKGHDATEVSEVLDRLVEVGLVDDVEFARAWLAGRWGRRAAGWRSLEQSLRQKGVSSEDVAAARAKLEEREGSADEVSLARRVIAQSERRFAKLDPRQRRQRLWALLMRRGFDGEVIREALDVREETPAE
jgi:regulatory protein